MKKGQVMYYLCRKPLPEFVLCAMRHFEPGEHHVTRIFDKSVLILMLEGILRFEEGKEEIELYPGEYYIQRAGLFQNGRLPSERPVYFYLHMDASFSDKAADGIPVRGKFSQSAVKALVEEYERRFRSHEGSYFALNGLMYEIFAELENGTLPANTRTLIARDIKRFIASEYAGSLSLSRIAERYGYSEDYTIKLFKNEFGITPYQYLLQKRLAQAEHLLLSTSDPVEEISRKVGYNDFSTFYRDFRKKYGMSPSAKRAKTEAAGEKARLNPDGNAAEEARAEERETEGCPEDKKPGKKTAKQKPNLTGDPKV